MRAAIARLVRADLRSRPVATLLLAALIAIAALTLSMTLALRGQMDAPFERVAQQSRGGDIHAVATEPGADLRPIAELDGVLASSGVRPVLDGTGRVGERSADVALEGLADPQAPVDRPLLRSGRWVAGPGEVVLERSLAAAADLAPGGVFRVTVRGREHALRVVGTAVTVEVGPFEQWDPGLAWVRPDALPAIAGGQPLRAVLSLRLRPGVTPAAFIPRAARAGRSDAIAFYGSDEVKESVTERARGVSLVFGTNTIGALLAVAFTIATAVGGRVLAQRRQIGILKAVGLTPVGVTASLIASYVAIAAVAAPVGTLAGAALSSLVLESVADQLNTTSPSPFGLARLLVSCVIVVAAVAAAVALPAWRAGRLATTAALAPSAPRGAARPSRLAALTGRLGLPIAIRFGLKDAFAVRARTALTAGSLVLMTTTMVVALSSEATFARVVGDSSLRAKPYEVRLDTQALPAERVRALAAEHRAVRAATTYESRRARVGRVELQAGILGDQPRAFDYAVPEGRGLRGPGEAVLGLGALEALGKQVGDRITVHLGEHDVALRIVGRHVEPDNDGMIARFTAGSLPAAARREWQPETVLVRLHDEAQAQGFVASMQRRTNGVLDPVVTDDEVMQERDNLRPAILAANVVLVLVALANLVTTLSLGIRERQGDLAVFKALGATPRQMLHAISSVAGLLTAIAVVIGIPLGLVLFRELLVASNPSDGPDIMTWPAWPAILAGVAGIGLLAMAASTLPARRAAAVKPMEVLRAE